MKEKICTSCGCQFTTTAKTMTICKQCNTTRVKAIAPEKRMFQRSKTRAKQSGREFTITLADIIIPTYCPVLGIELRTVDVCGGSKNSPSLDRIDSSKGYIPGNVWVISKLANQMKANASDEELKLFARWVADRK